VQAIVAVETLVLVLLSLLVVGLLRSHAEILRRLGGEDARTGEPVPDPERVLGNGHPGPADRLPEPRDRAAPVLDIVGKTLSGDAVKISVAASGQSTLIAFLSSGCLTCRGFWDALNPSIREPIPGGARLVIVTRDATHESPSKLRELAPPDVPVIMSSASWDEYQVPVSPYFIYVDGPTGEVHGEGAAERWQQVVSLLRDALADAETAPGTNPPFEAGGDHTVVATVSEGRSGPGRSMRTDQELDAAGIVAGHPSLYAPDDPGVA
jgi:hypothetical protein